MAPLSKDDVERAKLDPATVFASPQAVLDAFIPDEDKLAILTRWEADADALLRAGDEGMGDIPANAELLQAVQDALETLRSP